MEHGIPYGGAGPSRRQPGNDFNLRPGEGDEMLNGPRRQAHPTVQANMKRADKIRKPPGVPKPGNAPPGMANSGRFDYASAKPKAGQEPQGNAAPPPMPTVFEQAAPPPPVVITHQWVCPSLPSCPSLSPTTKKYLYSTVGIVGAGLLGAGAFVGYKYLKHHTALGNDGLSSIPDYSSVIASAFNQTAIDETYNQTLNEISKYYST